MSPTSVSLLTMFSTGNSFQHELPVLNIVNSKRTIKDKQGRATKEAENALWGEKDERLVRSQPFCFRLPELWAVLGGDGQ